MPLIDEDHITQAVIASHAGAADARLRDVMTSLVQHLHAFAREVKLSEPEWRAGLRFLAEAGRAGSLGGPGATAGPAVPAGPGAAGVAAGNPEPVPERELAALSQALGLTLLVASFEPQRPPQRNGARPVLRADFDPAAAARGTGPVARLLRALHGRASPDRP
ncbi:MAG: hypothetical protein JNL85_01145 [Rubrivivax sp.]|nr:hypothetical protein [Rubrivivax sp.]